MHLNEDLIELQVHHIYQLRAALQLQIDKLHALDKYTVWSIFRHTGKKTKIQFKKPLISHTEDLVVIE